MPFVIKWKLPPWELHVLFNNFHKNLVVRFEPKHITMLQIIEPKGYNINLQDTQSLDSKY
jgi:hypothetical protein